MSGPSLVNDEAARLAGDAPTDTTGESAPELREFFAEARAILGPDPTRREVDVARRFYAMGSSACFEKYKDKMFLAEARRPIVIPLTCEKCGHVAKVGK